MSILKQLAAIASKLAQFNRHEAILVLSQTYEPVLRADIDFTGIDQRVKGNQQRLKHLNREC